MLRQKKFIAILNIRGAQNLLNSNEVDLILFNSTSTFCATRRFSTFSQIVRCDGDVKFTYVDAAFALRIHALIIHVYIFRFVAKIKLLKEIHFIAWKQNNAMHYAFIYLVHYTYMVKARVISCSFDIKSIMNNSALARFEAICARNLFARVNSASSSLSAHS